MISEITLILNFILPLLAALSALSNSKTLNRNLSSIFSFLLVINNLIIFLNKSQTTLILAKILNGYVISVTTEPLANIFAIMVSILYFITNLYSFAYLKAQEASNLEKDLHRKINFFFTPIAIMACLNIAYSSNLITLFTFYEVLTLSTYPLVVQSFSEHAKKAGRYYLGILFTSSSFFLLLALVYIDNLYGPINFKLGGVFDNKIATQTIVILMICFIFGFSKTAIFPLHKWLPKAMVAPTPVSALLHAVAVVKSGIFALIKVFIYFFGINFLNSINLHISELLDFIRLLACFTIMFAGVKACFQTKLKNILAYSTIVQLSYMILSLSFITLDSTNAAFTHMLSHSIGKITLFFATGIIYVSICKTDINDMHGIIRIVPGAVILFILSALSIIGIPGSIGYLTLTSIYNAISCQDLIGSVAITCMLLSKIMASIYFGKAIFLMVKPATCKIELYYKANSLTIITIIAFSLSLLLFIYLNNFPSPVRIIDF